ncbi:MAG TPA: alpha/beta hydrolase [Verrucomicrobiaceae bacterium]
MIRKIISMLAGAMLCATAVSQSDNANPATSATASRATGRANRKNKGTAFDPKSYLEELSAEARQRGFMEFPYKQTPQGELRIFFKMPEGWTENDKRPVMVFFFGGGWSGGSPFACVKEAEHFAKNGMVVGLADYRVRNRQGTMLDQCAEDARSAVRWVRANHVKLGADPDRLIVGGGSAGGHIAACTANAEAPNSDTDDLKVSCKPDALLLYYPVASLVDGSRGMAFKRLLGDDLAKKLSPVQFVTQSWPPTVMFSGTADIELENGILLHNKARDAGVKFELYLAEGHGHGVARTEPRDFAWLNYASDFFTRLGLIEKPPALVSLPDSLRKYTGGPLETKTAAPENGAPKSRRRRGAAPVTPPAPEKESPAEAKP